MAIELRLKEFSALPVADDGKTLLYADGEVKQSSKNLSEMLTDEINNKLDTVIYSAASGKWENASDVVIANSGTWGPETDWTEDIKAASANAYEQALTQIDLKMDKSFSSNFYPRNENPNGYLTEHQDLSDYATKTYVNEEVGKVGSYVTATLVNNEPDVQNPSNKKIYLTKIDGATEPDLFKEWIYTESSAWECIGDTSIDLSDYATISQLNTKEDKLRFGYNDNDSISSINGSALAVPEVDLSNYYKKTETSGKEELSAEFYTKQDIIKDKKDSSIPYLETSGSDPSWETIETSTINAHGTAEEGELYDIPINGRTYKVVCLNGKLWLAENYVNEAKATYTHPKYGSYFNKATINSVNFVPQGWHIPSKEEWQELIDAETDHCEKYLSTTDWHQGTDYATGTNELKLNILPGSEYNIGRQEISSEYYNARFWTSTDEILSQSTGKQRVYAKISNYIGYNSKIISFDWDGPGSLYYFPVRLIKDDLEVPAPDGWKKFNGRNFMAIADDEGNTFKDFYLKTSAAQQLYQPKGDYASSASVTVLNTYYGLTTTGWIDISTNYYDKQTIDSMITGGGDYVEHSELTCKIGTGNTGTNTAILIQGKNNLTLGQCALVQGENNIAGYYSFAQGTDNIAGRGTGYPNYAALAQGWANTAENYCLAQGYYCSAVATAFAQGNKCSASNYSFAQGNQCYAYDGASFAQGQYASATNWGVAFGDHTSATNNSFVLGSYSKSINWSMAAGQTVSAYQTSFAQGQSVSASNYSIAQGSNVIATGYSIVQGQYCTAYSYSFAQGGWYCSAYNQSLAQGTNCSAKDQSIAQGENCIAEKHSQAFGKGTVITNSGMAIGTYNKTSANVAFVIGNGTGDSVANRKDLFTIDKSGIASGGDFITSAGKKLSDCITTLPTITEYVAGTGIVFTAGTGADEGKTVIEVDSTNYKLLTTAEYNDLTAAVQIVADNSAKWVLTN